MDYHNRLKDRLLWLMVVHREKLKEVLIRSERTRVATIRGGNMVIINHFMTVLNEADPQELRELAQTCMDLALYKESLPDTKELSNRESIEWLRTVEIIGEYEPDKPKKVDGKEDESNYQDDPDPLFPDELDILEDYAMEYYDLLVEFVVVTRELENWSYHFSSAGCSIRRNLIREMVQIREKAWSEGREIGLNTEHVTEDAIDEYLENEGEAY